MGIYARQLLQLMIKHGQEQHPSLMLHLGLSYKNWSQLANHSSGKEIATGFFGEKKSFWRKRWGITEHTTKFSKPPRVFLTQNYRALSKLLTNKPIRGNRISRNCENLSHTKKKEKQKLCLEPPYIWFYSMALLYLLSDISTAGKTLSYI